MAAFGPLFRAAEPERREGKVWGAEPGLGLAFAGQDCSAKPTSNSSRSQEPPPVGFLCSDPWSEHPPGSTSIAQHPIAPSALSQSAEGSTSTGKWCPQAEPFSHPNSCLCKLSAIPDCHHGLHPTKVLQSSGRKVFPYLPTISCSALPCHVKASRHKPSAASSALVWSCHAGRNQPLPEKLEPRQVRSSVGAQLSL